MTEMVCNVHVGIFKGEMVSLTVTTPANETFLFTGQWQDVRPFFHRHLVGTKSFTRVEDELDQTTHGTFEIDCSAVPSSFVAVTPLR